MAKSITLEEAQADLRTRIDQMDPGEELVFTDREQPVAKLISQRPARHARPAPGLGKGSILCMASGFDELPGKFGECVE